MDSYNRVMQVVQQAKMDPSEVRLLADQLKENYKTYDEDYLKAALFPDECEAARIPSKFPISSALATQTFSFYMNTGDQGKGYVTLLPQDLSFYCAYKSTPSYDGNPTNSGNLKHTYVGTTDQMPIYMSYSSARVVGASIRVQYIGEAQQESGFLVGSHVFDSTLGRISEEVVENGYYITRGRPSQGIRLAYMPKDESDLEYVPLDFRVHNLTTGPGEDPLTTVANFDYKIHNDHLRVDIFDAETQTFVPHFDEQGMGMTKPDQVIGQGAKRFHSVTPYQLVVNWVGLTPGKDWIRVDIVRHLECIPRMAMRDIIATKKCTPNTDTIDNVHVVPTVDPSIASNTIEKHEQTISWHAQGVTPNGFPDAGLRSSLMADSTGNRHQRLGSWAGVGRWISKVMGYVKPVWDIGTKVAPYLAPLFLNQTDDNLNTGAFNGQVRQGLNTFSKAGFI